MVDDATMNIKASARSKVAVAELQDQITELTEDADTSTWDVETSFAVLQAAEAKDQLSEDEKTYMAGAALRMVALVPVVESSVSSSADLIDEAPGLVSGARSAFGLRSAGGAARNVRSSADRISNIPTEGAGLLEQLVVLNRGFAMLRSLNAED